LPVNHGDMFARSCEKCNRWNLARYFSNIWGWYRRGHISGHCSGRWISRIQFYLTVPSGWAKASAALCWRPRAKQWVVIESQLTSFAFSPPYTSCSSSFLFSFFLFSSPLDSYKFFGNNQDVIQFWPHVMWSVANI
jgi:hypothetical protein